MWFNLALKTLLGKLGTGLSNYRDLLAAKMSPEAIIKVQRLAA